MTYLPFINVLAFLTASFSQAALAAFSDGPYVSVSGNKVKIDWVCNNKAYSKIREQANILKFDECNMNIKTPLHSHKTPFVYNNVKKYAALSDVHGQLGVLQTLLFNHQIIDANNNWKFGAGHLIITGDIFDRGPDVTKILWLLYSLEAQALSHGGKLHLLLGNHEVMVLNNDDRYLHKKYEQTERLLEKDINQLYARNTVLGQWLRSKHVILKLNNALFMHGGLPVSFAHEKITLSKINSIFSQHLVSQDRPDSAKHLFDRNGPIWYRGYFNSIPDEEVSTLLKHYEVDHIVVGHTSQSRVKTTANQKIIAIDSSIKHGKQGELLLFKDNTLFRGKYNGETEKLLP